MVRRSSVGLQDDHLVERDHLVLFVNNFTRYTRCSTNNIW